MHVLSINISPRATPGFDVAAALEGHECNAEWGALVQWLQLSPLMTPRGGVDAGDHPPISPMRAATRGALRGGPAAWGLYSAVVRHFIATLLPTALADQLLLVATVAPCPLFHDSTCMARLARTAQTNSGTFILTFIGGGRAVRSLMAPSARTGLAPCAPSSC